MFTNQSCFLLLVNTIIEHIPTFSGNNDQTLEVFIDHCDSLMNSYRNNFSIRSIINKLQNKALRLTESKLEFRQWSQLKE